MADPGPAGALEVRLHATHPIPLDIAFTAPAGAITALVGPSGAGKSTVLRAIAGLHPVERGRIVCGGDCWFDADAGTRLSPQARRIGLVFQDYALFPHLTAAANVAAALGHLPRAARGARARELLAAAGLAELGDRKPAALSGGQRQRVAIARALAREPAALLLDEPFSAVDRPARRRLHRLIAELHDRLAIPILLVTHDLTEVATLADHLLVIDAGRLLQAGPTTELLAHPCNPQVAELLDLDWPALDLGHVIAQVGHMTQPTSFDDVRTEFEFLDKEDRYRLLIELGRALEPMPAALKTDATKVRGCSAQVWVYPTELPDGRLHFHADSDAHITKGIVALILLLVQDRTPGEILAEDIAARLAPFELSRQLSSNRTQGIPNMIELIRATAARLAA